MKYAYEFVMLLPFEDIEPIFCDIECEVEESEDGSGSGESDDTGKRFDISNIKAFAIKGSNSFELTDFQSELCENRAIELLSLGG